MFRTLCLAAAVAVAFTSHSVAMQGQRDHGAHHRGSGDGVAEQLMQGRMRAHGPNDPHMKMSPVRPEQDGDRVRAYELAVATRRAIRKYKDVALARADGYRPFGDTKEAKHIHFVHLGHSFRERWGIDPQRPGSLLYDRVDGKYVLVGAMFGAGPNATLEELDQRVPLSQTRWHQHINICVPRPIWSREKWALRAASGKPVYGPFSDIATRDACEKIGGRFRDTVFGWMVHVYPFREDPAMWWHEDHAH